MSIFDIIGPVMVGPSSSHTAGANRIGNLARKLCDSEILEARIGLHGSFWATGKGHGTDKALLAGLLGIACDDEAIKDAFAIAKERGFVYHIVPIDLGPQAHPNSVQLNLKTKRDNDFEIVAASIGGGQIEIHQIDGLRTVFQGNCPTLVVQNDDRPGEVYNITKMLYEVGINIATVQLDRDNRGGHAVTVIECDQEIPSEKITWLKQQDGILKVTYLSLKEDKARV